MDERGQAAGFASSQRHVIEREITHKCPDNAAPVSSFDEERYEENSSD